MRRAVAYLALTLALTLPPACGAGRADLQLQTPATPECRQDERGNLILEIVNLGGRQTIATTTRVAFPGHPPFLLPTRPIPGKGSTTIQIPAPEGCRQEPCTIVVTLDVRSEVGNAQEELKQFQFRCRLRPFKLP